MFNAATFTSTISNFAIEKSVAAFGSPSYGYALGYFESQMKIAFREINLTKQQEEILLAHLESLK